MLKTETPPPPTVQDTNISQKGGEQNQSSISVAVYLPSQPARIQTPLERPGPPSRSPPGPVGRQTGESCHTGADRNLHFLFLQEVTANRRRGSLTGCCRGGRELVYVSGGYGTFLAGAKLARGRKRRERLAVEPPEVERMLERDTTGFFKNIKWKETKQTLDLRFSF